jgi:hypothetical protein
MQASRRPNRPSETVRCHQVALTQQRRQADPKYGLTDCQRAREQSENVYENKEQGQKVKQLSSADLQGSSAAMPT